MEQPGDRTDVTDLVGDEHHTGEDVGQPPHPDQVVVQEGVHREEDDPAFVFSHDENHEHAGAVLEEDSSAFEAKRAEITKTFFQAFFEYPTDSNAQDYQVPTDEIDFLYDNVIPVRYRHRKQERAKYRLNELRDVLQRHSDELAAGLLPPPPPLEEPMAPAQQLDRARKRRKIHFDKKAWSKRERGKSYWLGMRGPFFPAQHEALHKLAILVGHPFPHLNEQSFRAAYSREITRREEAATYLLSHPKPPHIGHLGGTIRAVKAGAATLVASAPTQQTESPSLIDSGRAPFPVYDMWRDADQATNPNAPHHYVHFVFDVPGVIEEPKFSFSKATRQWQLEGTRTIPGVHYLTQLRASGRFVVKGVLPASVDVHAMPKTSFGNGILHITIADHVE